MFVFCGFELGATAVHPIPCKVTGHVTEPKILDEPEPPRASEQAPVTEHSTVGDHAACAYVMRRLVPGCPVAVAVIVTAKPPRPPSTQRPWTVVGQKSGDRVRTEFLIVVYKYDALMPGACGRSSQIEPAEAADVARAVVNAYRDRCRSRGRFDLSARGAIVPDQSLYGHILSRKKRESARESVKPVPGTKNYRQQLPDLQLREMVALPFPSQSDSHAAKLRPRRGKVPFERRQRPLYREH